MNKIAIVTGGSRGIGKAIALGLADLGYSIVVNYRSNSEAADAVVNTIKSKNVDAIAIGADVSSLEGQKQLINQTIEKFGRIDVLVNNAGITRDNLLIRMKPEEWSDVINTNLMSLISLTDMVVEHMSNQKSGKIINISSVVGVHGNAGQANYATAKAGVLSMTKIYARQNMPYIQVNAIAPGLVATDMTAGFDLSKLENTALGRAAKPEDIANCVKWLVEADYTTGQVIEIDGGLSLWSDVGQAFH